MEGVNNLPKVTQLEALEPGYNQGRHRLRVFDLHHCTTLTLPAVLFGTSIYFYIVQKIECPENF